jgi:tetratricopeptide (TPR) repeat protein
MRNPHAASRIPQGIRAALRRGLALDPAARFASIDDLLAELTPPPRRRARWLIGVGAALAVVGVLVTWRFASSPAELPDQRCTGAAAAFATAWNIEQQRAIEVAFTRTGLPYAAIAQSRFTEALDRYAARWVQAHTEACRATSILREQTDAILELRMACLERRRQEVAALVGTLTTADAGAVLRSMSAAFGLVDVSTCADVTALRQLVPPPTDAVQRAKLDELAPRLAEARATYEIGAYPRALELARPVVREAQTLAYLPFQAEAQFLQGRIEHAMGDRTNAETTLEAAVWSAEAGRYDEIAARGWIRLVFLVGWDKAEFSRALALVPRATAALARLGSNPEIESDLELALAGIDGAQGKYDSAIAHAEKALVLTEHAFGPDHAKITVSLIALGAALSNQGRPGHAVPILQRAYDIRERSLGPGHPDTAFVLEALANAHNGVGQSALAEQELRRALAVREASLGPRHPLLVYNLVNLATALDDQGKSEEAVAIDVRAVAAAEKAFGPEHLRFGIVLVDVAVHLGHVGRYTEARERLQRAEAIFTKLHGPKSLERLFVLVTRGDLLFQQSRWREAMALYEQSIPALEAAHIVHNNVTIAVINFGLASLELHQPARALPALERLASRLDNVRPDLRVAAEFTLARALWQAGGDRTRAHALATHALAAIQPIADAHHEQLVQIRRWLDGHQVRPTAPE